MYSTTRRFVALLVGLLFSVTMVGSAAAVGPRYTGQLELMHGDDFVHGRSVENRVALKTADGTYTLDVSGRVPDRLAGRTVTVTGSRSGNHLRVSSLAVADGGSTGGTGTSTAVASTTKKVAVILVNFLTNTSQPYTVAQANGIVFSNANSVASYFAEESYGALTMSGDVLGWYTVSEDTTTCNYTDIASKANSAATAAGVNLSNYTNYQYVFPSISACAWAGLAYMPGTQTWINQSLTLRTSSHELSHNFGVHHASTISCTDNGVRVALSATQGNCSLSEYGDPFSVMGSASNRHEHTFGLAQMGFVSTSDEASVTASGTYAVGVAEQSSSSPKVVRVARTGATNQYFYLEFRQPYGSYFDNFSSTDPAVTGVTIRIGPDYPTRTQSWLIDTTPGTSSYGDAPLGVGKTFTDPLSGVSITTLSVTSSGASVSISLGSGDTQPPSMPPNFAASATGATSMGLSWSASTDNVGVAGYRVSRNGTQVASTTGTSWSDAGLSPSTSYAYSVVAYDAAGNVSTADTASGTTSADTQAPSTPANFSATPTSSTAVSLTWSASTDNVGVAGYHVSRNGSTVATVSGTSWNDSGLTAGATYTYAVNAFDAAGNTSANASATVTLPAAPSTDTQPPTSVTLSGYVKNGQTFLSWTAATDNVGVAGYRIYRNGALFVTTTSLSYKINHIKGTWTYYVVAFDAAGNVSPASNSLTFTVKG